MGRTVVRAIFDCSEWLHSVEPHLSGNPLPVGWHTTSDSIAARIANVWRADELILCKSVSAGGLGPEHHDWVTRGIVDENFPRVCRTQNVRVVNLRDPSLPLLGESSGSITV